jgi:hypothetical protein
MSNYLWSGVQKRSIVPVDPGFPIYALTFIENNVVLRRARIIGWLIDHDRLVITTQGTLNPGYVSIDGEQIYQGILFAGGRCENITGASFPDLFNFAVWTRPAWQRANDLKKHYSTAEGGLN